MRKHKPEIRKRNPELTKAEILQAAREEFSEGGLDGARVDLIAARAGANKRMLYHYFGNKDGLFQAVLEAAYADIRSHEKSLDLANLEPEKAIKKLVRFTFNYFIDHPEFIRLLNNENLHGGVHVKRSKAILAMHPPLVEQIRSILTAGEKTGVFRQGVDPVHLYISIASLVYFYLSNAHTLGAIFSRDLLASVALKKRCNHVVDMVLGYLRP